MQKIIFFSLALLFIASCSSDKKQALVHFSKARELYKKEDIKNASQEIENAISLDSTNLDFQMLKADIISDAGNYEQAINILQGLLDKKYKLDTVNYYLGSCYHNYGLFFSLKGDNLKEKECCGKAIQYYNNTISNDFKYYNAHMWKVRSLYNLERFEDALITLNNAVSIFPDSSIVMISYKGIIKERLGDFSGAMLDLNTAIQSGKLSKQDLVDAYNHRGDLFCDYKKDYDSAINDYTNAINLRTKYETVYIKRGEAYLKKSMKDKACEDFRKAADLGAVTEYERIKKLCN